MTTSDPAPIQWAFVTPTLIRPTGGDIALFELVNALAQGERERVTVVHTPFLDGSRVRDVSDLPWMRFDPAVQHRFVTSVDPAEIGSADVVVYTMKLVATAVAGSTPVGGRLIDVLRHPNGTGALAILLLQGRGVFDNEVEDLALGLPGPKVCVSASLAAELAAGGVPADDIVHIANGVDPDTFRITQPIEGRAPHVAINFDPHPVKGGLKGVAALELLNDELGVPATVFGTHSPDVQLSSGVSFVLSPDRPKIAKEIYNRSSLYLQPSRQEGFGMCAVEAMACGCALVTTDNGGSADYAVDGETALVCGKESEEMVEALARLVRDDALRVRLARNGALFVERFRWSSSADRLAQLARTRLAGPAGIDVNQ